MLPGFTVNAGARIPTITPSGGGGGGAAPPSLVSSLVATSSGSTSGTFGSFTVPAYGVVVMVAGREFSSGAISSIGGTLSVSWTQYIIVTGVTGYSSTTQSLEVWVGINNSASSIAGTVIVNYLTTFDDWAGILSSWTGCNLTSPVSGTAYSSNNIVGSTPSVTFSTTQNNTTPVYFTSSAYATGGYATGWTAVNAALNGAGSYWEYVYQSYTKFTSPTSNYTVSSPATTNSGNIAAVLVLQS